MSTSRYLSRAALGVLALALWLSLASGALAGPPSHLPNSALGIDGFNHACGVAVDTEGNVYVASAGEGKIRIFDASQTELGSIANANEPCGLALNSQGAIFVSEKGTGEVVRYVPDDPPPFAGTPTYGPREVIDGDGDAGGIGVDISALISNAGQSQGADDSLYIAKGDQVDAYRNERQRITVNATAGTYTLSFNGDTTTPLPFNASHLEVQEALEDLTTIGENNVSVTTGNFSETDHLITFGGTLGLANVSKLVVDTSSLTGSIGHTETDGGLFATIGEGDLTNATGAAAYTRKVTNIESDRYLFVTDAATDEVKIFAGANQATNLKLRKTLKGPKAGEDFGFGPAGAYIAADPGNAGVDGKCVSIAEQACTAGHFLVYDDANEVLDEFEANGELLDQITSASFADAEPTALAIDRSGTTNDGAIYATSGPGAGSKLLAFDPLVTPGRAPLAELSKTLENAEAVAVDSKGNVYAAAEETIQVYDPSGAELLSFEDKELDENKDLAVDSTGKVYVLEDAKQVTYYTPSSYPPTSGTTYVRHEPSAATLASFPKAPERIVAIALRPDNDRLLVAAESAGEDQIIEVGSASEGSTVLNPSFGGGLGLNGIKEIAAAGAGGHVYVGSVQPFPPGQSIFALNSEGTQILARIRGFGGLQGPFTFGPQIAVDETSGHVLAFYEGRNVIEEYDASGAFVAQHGEFESSGGPSRLAIDSSGGPNDGNLYLTYDQDKPGSPDLWAFGPLSYGEPPIAVTGSASDIEAGNASLNGTVDPRGFEVEECFFEYLTKDEFDISEFAGAESQPCAESSAEIGKGTSPKAVHVDLSGLDPGERYRFRLVAENKYGLVEGLASLFGPPLLLPQSALPVLYDEATLRAKVDPSGLPTEYHFEYGTSESYGQSTPTQTLLPGEVPVLIKAPLTGLTEATEYHFRVFVENEAGPVEGPDQSFETLERPGPVTCPNVEFRTGLSANLPDCRVYELVTPAETLGLRPGSEIFPTGERARNNWLVDPHGEGAGESLAFFTAGTMPGFDGNGFTDGYQARRAPGAHPAGGWSSEIFGPSYVQAGGVAVGQLGVSSDQRYSAWQIGGGEAFEGKLPTGEYLRTPTGFEVLGQGSLGTDPGAQSRVFSADGSHVIFSSDEHLEPSAAPAGTAALYDRQAGEATAEVVSVKPDGEPFGAGEAATYLGTPEDGGPQEAATVAFRVGGVLYLHRDGETTQVAAAPNTYAGISSDGDRVFYASAGDLHAFDVEGTSDTVIAEDATFVNVSAEGSTVFFTSTKEIPGSGENEAGQTAQAGEHNLYLWDGASIGFIAILDPQDFVEFSGQSTVSLGAWTNAVGYGLGFAGGRAQSPTRSTPEGEVLTFQSHAQLSSYDNEGFSEVYRYEAAAPPGGQLICLSCDPGNAPPSADDTFESLPFSEFLGPVWATNLIPNIADDGQAVFFESLDRLLPEDANSANDVYEWRASGVGGCKRDGGCLALISSGQGEEGSYLFGMSPDGRDVFFSTKEKLVGADVIGSSSIYDARVEGGIPDPPQPAPCQGDACQGQGSTPPALPAPTSSPGSSGDLPPKRGCPKGKRKVKRNGKARCVAKQKRKGQRKRSRAKANHVRRAAR